MIGQAISHYQILEKLGEGGMGAVYKARDTRLNRFVAIKVLPPDKVSDPGRRARFVQEARAASALNHPNIITIYDIVSHEGSEMIVMEYVAGRTLDQPAARGGLKLNEALKYAGQIADALTVAHAAGIVHRDLKPANIMVTDQGLVKVLDFGLAKLTETVPVGDEAETVTVRALTQEGVVVGTAAYMSPEQARGEPVDARSDIFSFGAVLYEMVTGRRAFQGKNTASILSAVLNEEPKQVEGVPEEFDKLIARCLRKDRDRRLRHMDDVKVLLEELREDSGSISRRIIPAAAAPARRRGMVWAAGGFALALALSAAAWLGYLRRTPAVALEIKPLTSDPGREYHPSFSPDGTQVTYAWDGESQGNFDVYVKLIGGGTRLRLTTDPADEHSPAWSPDGHSIAFLRSLPDGKTAVCLVSPLGGPERKVAEINTYGLWWIELLGPYLAWSPDSKWLALVDRGSPEEPYGLVLLSVDTLERRKLTTAPVPMFGDMDPAFSPDGRSMAFVRHPGTGSGDLYVQQLTADMRPQGEPRKLTRETRFTINPAWTPDSHEILFISGTSFLDAGVWRIGASGAGDPAPLTTLGQGLRFLTISSRGGRLAFGRVSIDTNIWRAELTQPGVRAKAASRLIASTRVDWTPEYSPDGKKISFVSDRSGRFEVWVCDSDGANPVSLASFGSMFSFYTRWSPDGRHLLTISSPEGQRDIYKVPIQGGQPRRLTNHPAHDVCPRWSGDGRWIYFGSSRNGREQIWRMGPEGEDPVQITKNGGFMAVESTDGQVLYYVRSRGVSALWKAPISGGAEAQVLPAVYYLDFTVTKDGIYFSRPDPPGHAIEFFSFATGRTSRITETASGVLGMTVSPDGRWLLYAQTDGYASDLMLVENFR